MDLDGSRCTVREHYVFNKVLYALATNLKSSLLLQEAHSKECTASTNSTIQGLNIQEVIKSVHSTSSLIL